MQPHRHLGRVWHRKLLGRVLSGTCPVRFTFIVSVIQSRPALARSQSFDNLRSICVRLLLLGHSLINARSLGRVEGSDDARCVACGACSMIRESEGRCNTIRAARTDEMLESVPVIVSFALLLFKWIVFNKLSAGEGKRHGISCHFSRLYEQNKSWCGGEPRYGGIQTREIS